MKKLNNLFTLLSALLLLGACEKDGARSPASPSSTLAMACW